MADDQKTKTPEWEFKTAESLQKLLQQLAQQKGVHHAVAAVESLDQGFQWRNALGEANLSGAPMTPETPFHIASVDKLFTACMILKLYEQGRIKLDQPIFELLPQSLVAGLHRFNGVDYSARITVRHLLSHTSGLPDCLEEAPKGGQSLMERLFTGGDMAWTIEDLARIVRDDLTPHFPPQPFEAKRQKARYSDTNYQLLIAIIETVLEQPLHRVLSEWLFNPVGMRHSYLYGYSQPQQRVAEPATVWFEDVPLELPQALRSVPSVYSTVEDLMIFMRSWLRGEIFDNPQTAQLMQQRWNRFGFPLDAAALRSPNWPIEYGMGLMRFQLPRLFTPLRAIPAVIGHTGSTGSWLFYCPELEVLLCGTVDQATAGAVPYRYTPRALQLFAAP